jgi:hypothetical protein
MIVAEKAAQLICGAAPPNAHSAVRTERLSRVPLLQVDRAFRHRANVTLDGKGFGSSALKVEGRIFAMLTSRSEFVVKLPRERVDETLVGAEIT